MKIVRAGTTGVKYKNQKFELLCKPGLHLYTPFISKINIVSNDPKSKNYKTSIITKDKIKTLLNVKVITQIEPENSYIAFSQLKDATQYIDTCVGNTLRGNSAKLSMKELYSSEKELTESVNRNLEKNLEKYGYKLVKAGITGINVPNIPKEDETCYCATAFLFFIILLMVIMICIFVVIFYLIFC